MSTYKTKAIILSSYPYREHDRIITFYSDKFGRMEARARGVKKITSKLAGHLEPFIETELLLANGRTWDILAGSRTIYSREKIRFCLEAISIALVCSEAIKQISKPLSSDERVFHLLSNLFDKLEKSQYESKSMIASFLWDLLAISGFKAELSQCIHCKTQVFSGSFSAEGGGILCENCKTRDMRSIDIDEETCGQLKSHKIESKLGQNIAREFWLKIVDNRPISSLYFFESLNI